VSRSKEVGSPIPTPKNDLQNVFCEKSIDTYMEKVLAELYPPFGHPMAVVFITF